jgi:hypothetical protein
MPFILTGMGSLPSKRQALHAALSQPKAEAFYLGYIFGNFEK